MIQNPPLFTVSQYNAYVNELVALAPVLVQGEVSNWRDIPGRNFCYFDIKDEKSVAKCFQGFWHSAKVQLENGSQIKVFGYPSLQKNGSLVIDVREIQISGEGELMKRYQELKKKLEKEGLFDLEHKKEIPAFANKVGLIAGKNSSALADVKAELAERWGCKVLFLPCKVQGIYAKKEVTEAIGYFNKKQIVDVLIIARGGGSMEELQAFDSEEVVREIFASRIPIISAIGHEDHWTLCDFVSDARAKTPTKAAQLAVPDKRELLNRLDDFSDRAKMLVKNTIESWKLNIEGLERMVGSSILGKLNDKKNELDNLEEKLRLLNPMEVLKRGYAVVEKDKKRVRDIEELNIDDRLKVVLHNGAVDGKVLEKFTSY